MEAMTMGERRRIMTLYERDWPTRRIADAIGRSESGVRRVRQRHRERGTLDPLKRGNGRPPKVTIADRQKLAALVAAWPDATIDELLEQSGLAVSRSTIDRHVRALGLSFKKK
jgi:transposase